MITFTKHKMFSYKQQRVRPSKPETGYNAKYRAP